MPRPDASAKLAATKPRSGPPKGVVAAIVLLCLALIVGGGIFAYTKKQDDLGTKTAQGTPKGAAAGGKGYVVYPGKARAGAPTVDIYEDFQCPICKHSEDANGKQMQASAAKGEIKLRYHMLSFLDNSMQNDSSARSANAVFCAADQGKFLEYHDQVFANQPEKEGTGYTDAQLKKFAGAAGISGSGKKTFEKCVDDKPYAKYVQHTQDQGNKDGVNGTPTFKVDGKDMSQEQQSQLMQVPGSWSSVLSEIKKG